MKKNLKKTLNEFTNQTSNELNRQLANNVWTMVIFSENFRRNIKDVLNSEEITPIVSRFNELTSRHSRTIRHINFLHKFDKSRINSLVTYSKGKHTYEFGNSQAYPLVAPAPAGIVSCFCGVKPLSSTRIYANMIKQLFMT